MNAHRQHSYGSVHSPAKSPRAAEAAVLTQITRRLVLSSSGEGESFPQLVQALMDNRRFWVAAADDLRSDGNLLPRDLRESLLRLAAFVGQETSRVLARSGGSETLVAINRSLIKGLGEGDCTA